MTTPSTKPRDGRDGRLGRQGRLREARIWIALAVLLAVLPHDIPLGGSALTMMSLMGISIVFALSYNMLLGQTGMLSFGHAVYYGLGGFIVDARHER